MKYSLAISVLCLALCTGLSIFVFLGSDAPGRPQSTALAPAPPSELLEAVQELATRMENLERRITALELVGPTERVPQAEPYVTREEFEELLAALPKTSEPRSVVLGDKEREAYFKERAKQKYEHAAEKEVSESNADPQERVRTWSNWLELEPNQQQQLISIFARRDQMNQERLDASLAGTNDSTLKQMEQDNQREFVRSLRGILNPEQRETLSEKYPEEDGQ